MVEPTPGDAKELAYELAVLKALPGTTCVTAYPAEGRIASKSNDNGIRLKLPGGKGIPHNPHAAPKLINVHFGGPLDIATHVEAARVLKAQLSEILGAAVTADAEVTVQRTMAAAGTMPMHAFAYIGETQRLQRKLHAARERAAQAEASKIASVQAAVEMADAAETGASEARLAVAEAADALDGHTKRQRINECGSSSMAGHGAAVDNLPPPNWNHFSTYSHSKCA